jgi:uncharacterized protein (DUF342 family)
MSAAESLPAIALRVVTSDDLFDAFVVADSPFDGDLADLDTFLRAQGLAGPRDDEGIARFLRERPVAMAVRVVCGRRPTTGFDARIEYAFASLAPAAAHSNGEAEREPFAIDHRETHALERCSTGDVLARKVAGCDAIDGVDAYGRIVPAERAKEVKLAAGSNASLSEDGASIVANIDGVPSRDASGRVLVQPSVTVKNVDFKSGNIHFDGSVIIEGDVLQGFCVEASGDVHVKGSVEHATIRAGGSIHVGGGVRRHSMLRAARDVDVRFADSECHLEARGWVWVAQNAIQCELVGDEGVAVGGQLVSGRALSWNVVEAGILGCPHGLQTVVCVERPSGALRVQALREELGLARPADHAEVQAQTPSGIRPLRATATPPSAPARKAIAPGALSRLPAPGMLPGRAKAPLRALAGAEAIKESVKSKVVTCIERREREQLLAHAERELAAPPNSHGRVVARTAVRAGVTLSIAHDVRAIDEELGPRTFFATEGAIVEAPLAPASAPSLRSGK